MTRIDPNRIADLFRSLSLDKPDSSQKTKATGGEKETPVIAGEHVAKRDPENLRQRLKLRLSRLKQENVDFLQLAPEIAVREVLVWEFGDSILNHPDFNQVASSVTKTMQANHRVNQQLQKLIAQVT
jgi:hypothetical protein